MQDRLDVTGPLLSICIPSYNRAACLDRLLACLSDVVGRHGEMVQVCVSDNASPDGTAAIIDAWRQRFPLDAVTQHCNIGATRNVSQVVGLARGRWILVTGDDDLVDMNGLDALLAALRQARTDDWVLAGVSDGSGRETLLADVQAGSYSAVEARTLLRRVGLQRMGFIGMHVFPSMLRDALVALPPEASQPWPHIALLLRHVAGGGLLVCPAPLVQQAGAGQVLFWKQDDWMRLLLRMLDIVAAARDAVGRLRGFYDGLILRQLYDADALKGIMYWRFYEPADFRRSAVASCMARYRLLRWRLPLAVGHAAIVGIAWCLPAAAFSWVEHARGRGDSLGRYVAQRERSGAMDGMRRGL